MKQIALYTAIFGDFDVLKDPPYMANTSYYCFTDDATLRSGTWNITVVDTPKGEHPRLTGKRYKTMPHRFLPQGHRYSIYIDGSVIIFNPDFVERCISSLDRWGIACMLHPDNNCIFDEAVTCASLEKYRSQPILAQAEHYRSLGYPAHAGMAACGIIARDSSNETVMKIGEEWFQENLSWTYQDQLSFPFVLWRRKHDFDRMSFNFSDRSMFGLTNHLYPW